jgi:hypothetical protein
MEKYFSKREDSGDKTKYLAKSEYEQIWLK